MRLNPVLAIVALALTTPLAAPADNTKDSLLPDWVRPGLRLTYDLLTGGVNRSADQLKWDPETRQWVQANINRGYDPSGNCNGEYSSHGLIQTTVAGMDGQGVALSQPFFLLNPNQRTPVTMPGANVDMLVAADTGGDLWMHPRKQAQMLRHPPGGIIVHSTAWRGDSQSWTATTLLSQGASGKTFAVYDQASGKLLYLSRITREAPGEGRIRDPKSPTRGNPVSYATIIKDVAVRQLNIPWMNDALPEWAQQLQMLSYQGRQSVQFPGSADPPGQEIDRDPLTGFSVRVASADAQTVTLQVDGPDRSMMFVYERAQES